jgi:hypothetical protein
MIEVYETIGYLVLGFLSVMWLTKIAKCSLRDYFAAKAMQGLMHNYHPCDFLEHKGWLEDISMASYQMADAMMKAREA